MLRTAPLSLACAGLAAALAASQASAKPSSILQPPTPTAEPAAEAAPANTSAVATAPAGVAEAELRPELKADESNFDVATGDFIATGHAQVTYGDIVLTASEIRLNQKTFLAKAKGNVVITGKGMRLVGSEGSFNLRKRTVEFGDFRVGAPPWFASADKAEGTLDNLTLTNPRVYMGEPAKTSPTLRASSGSLLNQKTAKLDNPVVALGDGFGIPLPDLQRNFVDSGLRGRIKAGYSGDLGLFLRPEVKTPLNETISFVGGVEAYTRRGVMVAPGADYAGATENGTYTGAIRSGWIHDLGGAERRGIDILGRPIDQDRGLALWTHQQEWGNQSYLVSHLAWWSDSEVTRDYRWETYRSLPQPDSWAEFGNKVGNSGLFSVFIRTRADEFQPVVQRLPEIRYDLLPTQLGETGIVQKGFLSGAYLRRTYNDPIFYSALGDGFTQESARLDGYYGLEKTFTLSEWASLTPLTGARYTYDTPTGDQRDLVPGSRNSYTRALGVVGADLRLKAYGTFDVKNEVWGVNGLRHLVEPIVSYRYYGGANSLPLRPTGSGIEETPLGLFESEMELDRMRDTDTVANGHVVRAGVRNALQTRSTTGGSRDLAVLYVGQEYQPSQAGDEAYLPWNSLFAEARLLPASFLEVGWSTRYSNAGGTFVMSNPYLTLKDGRRWRLTLANHYLADLYNDYVLRGEVNLNEAWSTGLRLRYDERGERWRDQTYFLRQTLDNTWRVEYRVTRSEGDAREDSFGFGVTVDLLTF